MPKRTLTALLLLVIGLPLLFIGGVFYLIFMGFLIVVSAWEYSLMFHGARANFARWLIVIGVSCIAVSRYMFPGFSLAILVISILAALAFHLLEYERGNEHAAVDFNITVGALLYLGWIGSYLLDLRQLPNGGWWLMFVLPCVWMTDTGAYLIGAAYGKHKMTPRLSPKKSWEGFAAGAFSSMLIGGFLAYSYTKWGPLNIGLWQGAIFGLLVGLLTPLGDLGESMFKRQAGMKDSGTIFPGHGGAFDRIDSWLWAGVLGFFFITWFIH